METTQEISNATPVKEQVSPASPDTTPKRVTKKRPVRLVFDDEEDDVASPKKLKLDEADDNAIDMPTPIIPLQGDNELVIVVKVKDEPMDNPEENAPGANLKKVEQLVTEHLESINQDQKDIWLAEQLEEEYSRAEKRRTRISEEEKQKLIWLVAGIDHTRREKNCNFFIPAVDIDQVKHLRLSTDNIVGEEQITPLDFNAPYGPAYYNEARGSVHYRLCDHKPCRNAGFVDDMQHAVVKVLNMDGKLSRPSLIMPHEPFNSTPLPWTPRRGAHKDAEGVVEELEMDKADRPHHMFESTRASMLERTLMAVRKYPAFTTKKYFLETLNKTIKHSSLFNLLKRIDAKKLTPQEFADEFITACEAHLAQVDNELLWNPLLDPVCDMFEFTSNPKVRAHCIYRFQPFDLYGTWRFYYDFVGIKPAIYYKIGHNDVDFFNTMDTFHDSFALGRVFREAVNKYPSISTKKNCKYSSSKSLGSIDDDMTKVKVWYNKDYKTQEVTYCFSIDRKGVFTFPAASLQFYLDRIMDLIIVNGDNLVGLGNEFNHLKNQIAHMKHLDFHPFRYEFNLEDSPDCLKFLDKPRVYLNDYPGVISGVQMPIQDVELTTFDTITFTRYVPNKQKELLYGVDSKYLMTILLKLLRYAEFNDDFVKELHQKTGCKRPLDYIIKRHIWAIKCDRHHTAVQNGEVLAQIDPADAPLKIKYEPATPSTSKAIKPLRTLTDDSDAGVDVVEGI